MIRRCFSAAACAVMLLVATGAVAGASTSSANGLSPDSQAVYGVLTNGLKYVFYPNTEPRGRLFAYLRVGVGSAYERDDEQGIAHYLEHMAFNGSAHFEAGELVKYFQSIGMNFGGDVNAFTSFDQTAYSLDLPNTEPATIEQAFLLLGDYARGLSLLGSEVDRERGIILAEMGDRDSVAWRIRKAQYRFVYDDATLSRRMPIGLERTIASLTKEQFDTFYHRWYRPERMQLVVVGEMEFDTLRPYIERAFEGLTAGAPARPVPSFGSFVHRGIKVFNYADEEAKNTEVEIGVTVCEPRPPDTVELRRYEAARDLAEAMLNRRLQKLAKQEGAVFVNGTAYSYHAFGWTRHAGLSLTGEPEHWEAMVQVAEQELRRALTHGFTAAEIEEAKARRMHALDEAVMKAPTRESRALASRILHAVGDERIFLSPAGARDLLKDYLAELTAEEILAAFRQAWQAEHRLVMVTGNATAATEQIGAVYARSVAAAVAPPEEIEAVVFAYGTAPKVPGTAAAKKHLPELEIDQVDFTNGLRLNVRRTDFKQNEIRFKLRFGAGSSVLPVDKEGLDQLAGMIMIDGGLGQHSREEIKTLLAGRSVHLGFTVAGDHLAFAGSTIPADLELSLQLLKAYLTDAAYRPEALRVARKRYAEAHKGMERTLDGVINLKVERMLAGGDVRVGLPSLDVFNARSADEVKAWVDQQRRVGALELSIVGDVDVAQTVALVARYFGDVRAGVGALPRVKPLRFVAAGRHTLAVPTKIERGLLALHWKSSDAFGDIQRTRRLSMLGKVFSEYLREEVREKIGGAYSPWAAANLSGTYEDYGYLMAMVKIDPAAREEIEAAVLSIARTLYEDGTTAELFQRVMEPTRQGIKKYRRTNGYWMNVVSGSRARPEQIGWARSFVEDYEAMTVEEVNAYAKQYLDPDQAVVVVLEPRGKDEMGEDLKPEM